MTLPLSWAKRLSPWILLLSGSGLGLYISSQVRKEIEQDALVTFANTSEQVSNRIADRLQTLGLVLRSGAGVLSASPNVGRTEWRAYVQQLEPQLNLPGVQGIGFAQVIAPAELDAHITAVRGEGFPDYTVTPAGPRDFYSAIIYLEPFEGRNLRAFGYDMYSEPVRRAAMEQARDSGQPVLSGRVTLVQETETDIQAGTLMYFPVFRRGMPLATRSERGAALLGWTYSPYRMNDLINGILGDWQRQWSNAINLYIYDGTQASPDALLYSSTASAAPSLLQDDPAHRHLILDFNGHQWLLIFDSSPGMANLDYSPAWRTLGGILSNSVLLFALVLSLISTRSRAARIADSITSRIRAHEAQLAASEYRWKFALEGTGDGMWDRDVTRSKVLYSHRWKEMLGYQEEDIGSDLSEWEGLVHPDDRERTLAALQSCLAGETPQYSCEFRIRCKNGTYKWILDRGIVVARSAEGNALRMLGTQKDIDTSKLLEHDKEQYLKFFRLSPEPLLIAEPSGRIRKANPALRALTGYSEAELISRPFFDFIHPDDRASSATELAQEAAEGRPTINFENRLVCKDGSVLNLSWNASYDKQEGVTHASARNITASKQAQRRIAQLTRLYAALSACNLAILHCRTPEELFNHVCKVVVDHGKMQLAWIGLTDPVTGSIVPKHWAGTGAAYLEDIEVSVHADDPHGKGPTGTATRENRPVWVEDFKIYPRTSAWHARAKKFGWVSSAALPLCRGGTPIGALTFYSTEPGWFDDEIRALLEEMTHDISFALDKYEGEAEALNYQATLQEAEQRFRSLVEQSFVGAFIIQDRRFVYVNPHMENILGYPHDGSLIKLLPTNIVAGKDASSLQSMMDQLVSGKLLKIEHMFTAVRKDGTTVEVGTTISNSTYQQRPAIIGLLQDLSNRRVAEEQIKRFAQNLENVFLQTVSMATSLVEIRDPYTAGHEKHVADIAVAIGHEMQLNPHQIEGLRVGGYLHDVGKVTVPAEILAKPGRITPAEYELIKGHPTAGYDILKDVDFPWPVAQIALQHHERIDGSGYPQGLTGEQMLLESRIIAVADVVESMSSHRPYRAALGVEKALAEIEAGRGTKFDAVVVDACLRLFREKRFVLPQ